MLHGERSRKVSKIMAMYFPLKPLPSPAQLSPGRNAMSVLLLGKARVGKERETEELSTSVCANFNKARRIAVFTGSIPTR